MERVPVTSSHIAEVGYDPASQTLEVKFKDGSIYQYSHVPALIAEGLIAATSVGKYFAEHISKRGHSRYQSQQVQ